MFKDIYLFLKCLYGKKMINSLIYENHVFCTKGLFVRTCSNFLRVIWNVIYIYIYIYVCVSVYIYILTKCKMKFDIQHLQNMTYIELWHMKETVIWNVTWRLWYEINCAIKVQCFVAKYFAPVGICLEIWYLCTSQFQSFITLFSTKIAFLPFPTSQTNP